MKVGAIGLLLWLCARPAFAQPSNQELERRIAALEAEIAELKALVNAPGSASAPAAEAPKPRDEDAMKFGVSLDTFYMYSFSRPVGRVNLLRAYDVLSNAFSLNQANVLLEHAPDPDEGRRFGGRIDFQWGQATEALQGNPLNEPRPWVYRNILQAYGTYIMPVGTGLTVDFGKWTSSLSYESNYTKDQVNYSRSLWFNFLPAYHMGARVHYAFRDGVALTYGVTNGTQEIEPFNNFKDQFVAVAVQPAKTVTWNSQYYFGQEHPDVQPIQTPVAPMLPTQPGLSVTPVTPYYAGKLHIFDSYMSWAASPATALGIEGDYVISRNAAPAIDSRVWGSAAYARHQLTARSAVATRLEYLRDHGGLFTGVTQSVKEATFTYDFKPADGFLVRSEWRTDVSTVPFFLTHDAGVLSTTQNSLTLGVIWWWGTKRDAW